MAKNISKNRADKSDIKSTYKLSGVDLKFLEAVDYVIEKNKTANVKPDTDNAISKTVFGNRSIIGKVRASHRGITLAQLHIFATYFHLDFNYFFRDTQAIEYHAQIAGSNPGKGIMADNVGNIIGDQMRGTINMGDVHKDRVAGTGQKAENTVEDPFDGRQIGTSWNDNKKESEDLREQLHQMRKQRDQAREEQIRISEKYIKLLEQKNNI